MNLVLKLDYVGLWFEYWCGNCGDYFVLVGVHEVGCRGSWSGVSVSEILGERGVPPVSY